MWSLGEGNFLFMSLSFLVIEWIIILPPQTTETDVRGSSSFTDSSGDLPVWVKLIYKELELLQSIISLLFLPCFLFRDNIEMLNLQSIKFLSKFLMCFPSKSYSIIGPKFPIIQAAISGRTGLHIFKLLNTISRVSALPIGYIILKTEPTTPSRHVLVTSVIQGHGCVGAVAMVTGTPEEPDRSSSIMLRAVMAAATTK